MEQQRQKMIYWHDLFLNALQLDLSEYRDILSYNKEVQLGAQAPRADLLVIKKSAGMIDSEIGRLFLGHNLVEYKSPGDKLNLRTYHKVNGYAGLYVGSDSVESSAAPNDVTITFVRSGKPTGLLNILTNCYGCRIENPYAGIYYVKGNVLYPTQIIVTKELSSVAHAWLQAVGGKEPDRELYRTLSHKQQQANTVELVRIREIYRFLYQRYHQSFEQLFEEDQSMAKTFDDFVNQLAEKHIRELEQELDQYRMENDQYRTENDQYRRENEELRALLAAKE